MKIMMDEARVCIICGGKEMISRSVSILVEDVKFTVHMHEIMEPNKSTCTREKWWDDGSSEPELNSEEEEGSKGEE